MGLVIIMLVIFLDVCFDGIVIIIVIVVITVNAIIIVIQSLIIIHIRSIGIPIRVVKIS